MWITSISLSLFYSVLYFKCWVRITPENDVFPHSVKQAFIHWITFKIAFKLVPMEEGFSSKLSGCLFFTSIPWVSAILLNNRVWAHIPVNKIAHCFNKQEELSPLGVALAANVLTAPLCNISWGIWVRSATAGVSNLWWLNLTLTTMIVYCLYAAGCQIVHLRLLLVHPWVFNLIHATSECNI